ncbi:MAG TPA: hypothetical protein VMT05_00755 [Terriglobales bacterium]|jgi:hypothetical protein|nr:hypothetical protein [Terriglobales bacterium]
MRVDYTLPALQTETLPEMPVAGEAAPSFRDHLRSLTVQLPEGWEQQLRLDARPFTGTYIGPPPQPATLVRSDPETERSRWRSMLSRHSRTPAASQSDSSNGRQPVQGMLEMLLEMQQMEDSIVSRSVGVTRG